MKVVLVTGGAGYIGSHCCKELSKNGFLPVSFDNLSRGFRELVKWGPLEVGDIRDADRLRAVMETHQPDAVIHFAALAYVGESVVDPTPYYSVNVGGSATLLDAIRSYRPIPVVFSSSCAVYGSSASDAISEQTAQHPINPYGFTKMAVERLLAEADAAHGIKSVSLRYFNAAGADAEGETGELHDPEPHLIPNILRAADGELDHFDVYGTDYDTPDGTCIRDFIHVTDLAAAHVAALRHLENGGASGAFNLGSGCGYSIREVIRIAEEITGLAVNAVDKPRRPGDPSKLVANADKAKAVLGADLAFGDITAIIESAWKWRCQRQKEAAVRDA